MLEMLKEKRESVIAELNELENVNLDAIVEEKLNAVRESIKAEIVADHDNKVKFVNVKVAAIDELIAEEEAKAIAELENNEVADENIENIGG